MTGARERGPNTILPERAPVLALPLAFFLTAMLFLAALLAVAIWQAPLLAADYLHNTGTLAFTHLFTLGFGSTIATGAIYQIMPVLLYSRALGRIPVLLHLMLQTVGAITFVLSFLSSRPGWLPWGGSLLAASALVFLVNVAAMCRTVERWNWHGVLIAAAVLFYAATNVWGLVLAFNLRTGFLGGDPYLLLAAHLALGLVGWFSLLIAGVGLKLVPMFAPASPLPGWLVGAVGGALALGVVTFVAGVPLGHRWLWPGALLMALGALGYAGSVMYSFRHRRAGPLDFSVRFAVTSAAVLVAVAVAALSGMAGAWSGRAAEAGLTVLFVLAWIGGTILGMLLRILPFMVWLHRFRNRAKPQEKIPFLHEMYHPALGWTTYLCWFAGSALMAAGFAFAAAPLITGGAVVALAGLAAFGWALRQVLYHVPPGTAALYRGRK